MFPIESVSSWAAAAAYVVQRAFSADEIEVQEDDNSANILRCVVWFVVRGWTGWDLIVM